jgi:hypothetical protein
MEFYTNNVKALRAGRSEVKPPEVTKQKFYDIFGFKNDGTFRGYLKNKSTTKSTSMFFPIMREHVKGYGPPDLYLDGMLLKQNRIFLDIG